MEATKYKVGGWVFTAGNQLAVLECKTCGIPFAIPDEMYEWAKSHPDVWWHCPNGHRWHFPGKTDEEKLKEMRDRLARERAEHDQTRASLVATKGAATRARNERDRIKARAGHGVCPVDGCHRTVSQLARHIKSKHPDYALEQP